MWCVIISSLLLHCICFLCQQIVKYSLRKHATDNTGQNSKEMLRRALCNGYFCNVARKWECFFFSKIITSFFFLHMYIVTHFNLNLYTPISTYKFSKLVSIHFLIELIEGVVQSLSGDRKYVTLQPRNCKPWPLAGVLKGRKRGFGARDKREGCARAREKNLISSPSHTGEFTSPSISNACHVAYVAGVWKGRERELWEREF